MQQFNSVIKFKRYFFVCITLLFIGVSGWSQKVAYIDKNYKKITKEIKLINSQLEKKTLVLDSLNSTLQKLFVFRDTLLNDTDVIKSVLKTSNENLVKLGPVPEDGAAKESAAISKKRTELTNENNSISSNLTSLNLLTSDLDALVDRISGLKTSNFLSDLTDRSYSPFSKKLWTVSGNELLRVLSKFSDFSVSFWKGFWKAKERYLNLFLLFISLFMFVWLIRLPRTEFWRKMKLYFSTNNKPTEASDNMSVLGKPIVYALLAFMAGTVLYWGLNEIEFITTKSKSLFVRIILGTSVFVFILNLAKIKLQAGKVFLYDIMCRDGKAAYNRKLFVSVFALFVIDRIFSTAFELGDAKTRLLMAQAIFSCLPFALILFQFANVKNWAIDGMENNVVDKASFKGIINKINVNLDKEDVSDSNKSLLLLDLIHLFFKGIAIAIVLLILLGYIRLADFIFHRIILFAVFVVLMFALRKLIFWLISKLPFAKISTLEVSNDDDDEDENKQANEAIANFWLKAATDVILVIFAVPIFLYVIGFDWMDVSHWFELSISGFSIGAITISFKNIVSGLSIFFLILLFTRWLTSNLDRKFEKISNIGSGINNSIITIINYIGVVIAVLAALPVFGMSFSNLTVIAGALSVGIGFGLKNIVNDFVSGIILLFDRPIKIGDLVYLPSGQGHVEKINSRTTIIRKFDLSAIIVPNSELVTTSFINWFYKNKNGRLDMAIGVGYDSDPQLVKKILLQCVNKYKHLMTHTAPYVIWTSYGDSTLNFELRAYFRNYDDVFDAKSDLYYAIFKEFEKNDIMIPFPQRDIHIVSKGEMNQSRGSNVGPTEKLIKDKKDKIVTKVAATKKSSQDKKDTIATKAATIKKTGEDKKE